MDQEKFGKMIKDIRKQNHLTQKEFAEKYHVTYQAVSKWENGINMPDTALIKQISKDFNVSLDSMFDGEIKKKKDNKVLFVILSILILIIIIFLIVFGIKYHQDSNFNFKTLESMCEDFKISGSLSYNDKKSSIYIANIDYCGKEDNTIYTDIECVLYESHENINKEITRMNYDGDSITLDEYLSSVVITVDDYKQDCKKYSNNSLFLSVNAKDLSGKTITYTIPLSFGNTCSN